MEGMTDLPEIKSEIKAEDFVNGSNGPESSPASQASSQNAAVSTTAAQSPHAADQSGVNLQQQQPNASDGTGGWVGNNLLFFVIVRISFFQEGGDLMRRGAEKTRFAR